MLPVEINPRIQSHLVRIFGSCRCLFSYRHHKKRIKPVVLKAAVFVRVATRVAHDACAIDVVVNALMHMPVNPQASLAHQMSQIAGIRSRE